MPLNAHVLVRETAEQMAAELFEDYARQNNVYAAMRQSGQITEKQARRRFIKLVAPRFFEEARKALTKMLAGDYPESTKQKVYEALVLDNALRGNRTVAADVADVPTSLH